MACDQLDAVLTVIWKGSSGRTGRLASGQVGGSDGLGKEITVDIQSRQISVMFMRIEPAGLTI